MPVTLAQASLNAASDIDRNVIDEFRKSSWLWDNLQFDDAVNPAGGGGTLVYGYQRLVTQASAAFRAINAEYTPQEATKTEITTNLKIFGGSFQIDRVLNRVAQARETAFQMAQKIKAARALFNDAFINGDSGANAASFDGLAVALAGSSTDLDSADNTAWQGAVDEDKAYGIMADLDTLLGALDGPADAIIANKAVLNKVRAAARRLGYFAPTRDEFGRSIDRYNDVALVDMGAKPGSSSDVISIAGSGVTSLYAVRLGLDGVHAVSLAGQNPIQSWMPDFSTAGAVKTGEVEMVAAVALKATKAAAKLDIDTIA